MTLRRPLGCLLGVLLSWPVAARAQQQVADPDFDARPPAPAYRGKGPRVAIDEAHLNAHTASGRYRPLADLLRHDGYRVMPNTRPFDERGALSGIRVLIVANAGSPNGSDTARPAFTERECDAVRDWVRHGGALLLVADHAPYGATSAALAQRFGVDMGNGWVFDHAEPPGGFTTQLVFGGDKDRLGRHAVIAGRHEGESVRRLRSFTGQSLGVPPGGVALLRLGPDAREAPNRASLDASFAAASATDARASTATLDAHAAPVGGRAQGVALTHGKGRVVILGEAAMLTAQVVRLAETDGAREFKVGMNVPGYDGRQFALNVMHWLSRALN